MKSKFVVGISVLALALSIFAVQDIYKPGFLEPDECEELCEDSFRVITKQFTLPATNMRESTLECAEDELVTGGGFEMTDDPQLHVWKNAPRQNGKGWMYGISNYGTNARSVTIYAICMKVKP